jgi:pimeloyl-ACP methyl ester carboxylesterase
MLGVLMGGALAHAQPCAPDTLPPAGTSNFWYCDTGSDTVVVFVHGLNSDSRRTWLRSEAGLSGEAYWPRIVLGDPEFEQPPFSGQRPAIFLAGYYASVGAGGEYGMEPAAKNLWRSLSERLDGRPAVLDKRNLMFVAHSLGGVLIRDVLVQHAAELSGKRIGLLLVASPSKGSAYASRLVPPEWLADSALVKQLQPGSPYLTKLDGSFSRALAAGGPLSRLRGKEIYEHRIIVGEPEPDAGWFERIKQAVIETLAKTALRERVVERASATGYFPEPLLIPESNHVSIAHPKDLNHDSHRALREVFISMVRAEAKPCDPPAGFQMILEIRPRTASGSTARTPSASAFELIQLDAVGEALRHAELNQESRRDYYRLPLNDPPFACPGEEFLGKLLRKPSSSALQTTALPLTGACFRRSRRQNDEAVAILRCKEGEECQIDRERPGLAETCIGTDAGESAYEREDRKVRRIAAKFWTVPSLATLEGKTDDERSGYTEFTIDSQPLESVTKATDISFAVQVNDVPVYMDGSVPHARKTPFNGKGGVHITFALENLGFTGGTDGYEKINVEIRFYRGKDVIRTARLQRDYVSYRHAKPLSIQDANSADKYEWRGYYRPAVVQASYEVMIEHGQADWIKERRLLLNLSHKRYQGLPVVGVIRPGREENERNGLIVGLSLATGQVQSLFSRDEAQAICRWITRSQEFDALQREGAYIFEFPARTFTELMDRGRKVAFCRQM